MNFEIREIKIEDAKAYYRLRLEALESEPEAFAEAPGEFAQKSIGEIRTQIELEVGSNNTRAYKLYESLGFKTCGQQPRTLKVGNNFIDEHLMVLKLR
jgi:ribosomal protein S18 acetylase RimI-like enzyme